MLVDDSVFHVPSFIHRNSVEKGIGYYNFNTREACDVLVKRIDAIINEKKNVNMFMNCLSLTIVGLLCAIPVKMKNKAEIEVLNDEKRVAEARRDAAGPSADLSLPADLEERLKSRNKDTSRTNDGGGGVYYNDPLYYSAGAACGVITTGGGYEAGG